MHFSTSRLFKFELLPTLCVAGAMAFSAGATAQNNQSSEAQTDNTAAQTSAGATTAGGGEGTAAEPRGSGSTNRGGSVSAGESANVAPGQSAAAPAPVKAPDLTTPNTEAHYFADVDYTNDYRLVWEEVITFYEPEIREAGWTRAQFLDEFDTDEDEFLDEEEYSEFLSDIGLEEPENRSSFIDID